MWDDPAGGGPVPIGQHMANLRRKGGLGKDSKRAEQRAAQLAAIDPDWNCPWPLNWQRHYRILADLAEDEPGGMLPEIQPGVLMDGDDLGKWLQQQKQSATWAQLLPEQQQRLVKLGVQPDQSPALASAAARAMEGPSKARQAFQRGLAALTQWMEREGYWPVPRGHSEEISFDGQEEPVTVKPGVWISSTRARRDRLAQEQLDALRKLGIGWI
jgi:Helicase associated domain.